MHAIHAVLFDLDNTLYENDEALEEWARESAYRLISADQFEQLTRSFPAILKLMASKGGAMGTGPIDADDTDALLRLIPGLSVQAAEFVATLFSSWLADMQLTPDAAQLLDLLDSAGIPYGIVTNAPIYQRIKTARLGLERRTGCIFISQEFGVEKPEPAIFLAAAECLGVPCENTLFVGDSPAHDVAGAHGSGIRAAWLRRGRDWPGEPGALQPDYVIDSLMDVVEIVNPKS